MSAAFCQSAEVLRQVFHHRQAGAVLRATLRVLRGRQDHCEARAPWLVVLLHPVRGGDRGGHGGRQEDRLRTGGYLGEKTKTGKAHQVVGSTIIGMYLGPH